LVAVVVAIMVAIVVVMAALVVELGVMELLVVALLRPGKVTMVEVNLYRLPRDEIAVEVAQAPWVVMLLQAHLALVVLVKARILQVLQ
jgi:hypothetical protein